MKNRSPSALVVFILARVLVWGMIAGFFVFPIAGCGALGYFAVAHQHPSLLATLTWTIFLLGLFVGINVSPASIGFDLTPLLRFPIGFSRYLLVRLMFGFFAIPTVVANLALASAAVGIGVANHALFPWAALVLGVFALHNVFFLRMVFAWVDRWMATRRAREIFGAMVLFASLGFQLAFIGNRGHRSALVAALLRRLAPLHPVTRYLPPSLAADAIIRLVPDQVGPAFAPALASLLGLLAFALASLAIFALRLQREFRGENLSEAARRAAKPASGPAATTLGTRPDPLALNSKSQEPGRRLRMPSTISACLGKELLYLKRSGAQLYGLITPLFFVFILARRNTVLGNTAMLLPYAVSYTLFGLLANLYNVLGADGAGFTLYLLAPVRLRDVVLSKNLVSAAVIGVEILLTCIAVSIINGGVPPVAMVAATLTWAAFALLTNLAVGNLRSLLAPKRFEPGKQRRAVTAKGSSLVSLGVLAGTVAAGIATILLCRNLKSLWLATPIFLALATAGLGAYLIVLGRIDSIALEHREELTEALSKT